MIINFIGEFKNGYVGEISDLVHLAREMESLGHTVRRIPQDAWREYVIEGFPQNKYDVPKDLKADINIICKWHHFYDGSFINKLREVSRAPVFYWVWDYMQGEDWHMKMVEAADLYLGNDVRSGAYKTKNCYYFPFDVADGDLPMLSEKKIYDVTFFGSWLMQGDRRQWLTDINQTNPVTVFSWNYHEFEKMGFDAHEAVYGEDFARKVAQSKIILGFNVEPNCWGYWSNRVGKVLTQGGFLLQQYAPGMELFLRDGVEYFSSIEEAREKIDHYLIAESERNEIASRGLEIGEQRFSSKERVKDLMILIERYLKKEGEWQL